MSQKAYKLYWPLSLWSTLSYRNKWIWYFTIFPQSNHVCYQKPKLTSMSNSSHDRTVTTKLCMIYHTHLLNGIGVVTLWSVIAFKGEPGLKMMGLMNYSDMSINIDISETFQNCCIITMCDFAVVSLLATSMVWRVSWKPILQYWIRSLVECIGKYSDY